MPVKIASSSQAALYLMQFGICSFLSRPINQEKSGSVNDAMIRYGGSHANCFPRLTIALPDDNMKSTDSRYVFSKKDVLLRVIVPLFAGLIGTDIAQGIRQADSPLPRWQ